MVCGGAWGAPGPFLVCRGIVMVSLICLLGAGEQTPVKVSRTTGLEIRLCWQGFLRNPLRNPEKPISILMNSLRNFSKFDGVGMDCLEIP